LPPNGWVLPPATRRAPCESASSICLQHLSATDFLVIGPTSVVGSRPCPTFIWPTAAAQASTNWWLKRWQAPPRGPAYAPPTSAVARRAVRAGNYAKLEKLVPPRRSQYPPASSRIVQRGQSHPRSPGPHHLALARKSPAAIDVGRALEKFPLPQRIKMPFCEPPQGRGPSCCRRGSILSPHGAQFILKRVESRGNAA
jgi:hypothetical protein